MEPRQEHPMNFVLNINCEVNSFVCFSFFWIWLTSPMQVGTPHWKHGVMLKKDNGLQSLQSMQVQMQKWSWCKNQLHPIFNWHKHSRRSYEENEMLYRTSKLLMCSPSMQTIKQKCFAATSVDWLLLLSYSIVRLFTIIVR